MEVLLQLLWDILDKERSTPVDIKNDNSHISVGNPCSAGYLCGTKLERIERKGGRDRTIYPMTKVPIPTEMSKWVDC